ncbi:FkbM family methyltransferase [Methylorubrum populi]|jgi:FkbM family methyltransferase|uniref:FkbM family methyltransferase n=1 Tax=Methylorubrum rhodesianum TaxID=29427 RepID=UPI00190C73C0|nr:FkbM family methyltransferase [Methylorubrum rhodesianum]MBK3406085.1 FkbM family methyltransferase [Methylorubrum rhodesianum]MBY0144164.1 FkbM family methyltransferase [Methylorubrum populi]
MMLSAMIGRHGLFVHDERDQVIGRSLRLYGEWAEEEIYLLSTMVRSGDTVLDIGANVGTHTVAFSRMVGQVGRVVSIDGQARASNILALNITINGCDNVSRLEGLIGSSCELVFDKLSEAETPNIGAVTFRDLQIAASSTLDAIVRPLAMFTVDSMLIQSCRLMKIDVEGMELDALKGAQQTIERCEPFIYFEQATRANFTEIHSFLTSLGYKLYYHGANPFNANNFNQSSENIFGGTRELNILAVPNSKNYDPPKEIDIREAKSSSYDFVEELVPEGWSLPDAAYKHLPPVHSRLNISIPSELLREGPLRHHYDILSEKFEALKKDRILAQEIMEHQQREILVLKSQTDT